MFLYSSGDKIIANTTCDENTITGREMHSCLKKDATSEHIVCQLTINCQFADLNYTRAKNTMLFHTQERET